MERWVKLLILCNTSSSGTSVFGNNGAPARDKKKPIKPKKVGCHVIVRPTSVRPSVRTDNEGGEGNSEGSPTENHAMLQPNSQRPTPTFYFRRG